MSVMNHYREMSDADKAALKQLQAEASAKLGRAITLAEMIQAVTPSEPWPKTLPKC